MKKITFAALMVLAALPAWTPAQETPTQPKPETSNQEMKCPMHDTHSKMNERGEKGMGFSQTATTHHFFLKADGGVIQVEAKDSGDASNRDGIRMHLTHIGKAFSNGDFDIPLFVHDTVPPGVPEMKKLREKIHYSFEETANGGSVVIATSDKEALAAIHKFLVFQIEEHGTGDSTEIRQGANRLCELVRDHHIFRG